LINHKIEIFSIGSNRSRLVELSQKYNIKNNACENLEDAVKKISILHDENSLAMLSPAASSLDQFTSYKQRGNVFKELVSRLS
ncbi:UDP-N-acetylmuramoyl-L-alanine--D-glutamate ligase, partial [Arcobacter sp. 31_11_sub10_T18]